MHSMFCDYVMYLAKNGIGNESKEILKTKRIRKKLSLKENGFCRKSNNNIGRGNSVLFFSLEIRFFTTHIDIVYFCVLFISFGSKNISIKHSKPFHSVLLFRLLPHNMLRLLCFVQNAFVSKELRMGFLEANAPHRYLLTLKTSPNRCFCTPSISNRMCNRMQTIFIFSFPRS